MDPANNPAPDAGPRSHGSLVVEVLLIVLVPIFVIGGFACLHRVVPQ